MVGQIGLSRSLGFGLIGLVEGCIVIDEFSKRLINSQRTYIARSLKYDFIDLILPKAILAFGDL